MKLFSYLSSENVREISLVFNTSDYYHLKHHYSKASKKAEENPENKLNMLNLERLEDRIEHFEQHFKKFKKCYFQNRGFVTFRTHKVAAEVMEIYDTAILERRKTFLNHWKKRVLGTINNLIGKRLG